MLEVFSPFTRELIDEIPLHSEAEAFAMLEDAFALSNDAARRIAYHERIAILERLIPIMESKIEELTIIATTEGGKPYQDSKVEVLRAIQGVKSAIDTMRTMHGNEIPMGLTSTSQQRLAFTIHEPIGVVFAISAFNHPLNLIVHQVIPAIAAGTPIIIKPAGTTPRSCLTFIELLKKAGLPELWCQPLICKASIAQSIVSDSRIAFLSFIGSAEVGWKLRSLLAPGTRCALEHGGMAPLIMAEDAEIDSTIASVTKGAFYHSGQVCVSVQHMYVHDSIASEVKQKLIGKAESLIVGDPLVQTTECGPLIHPAEVRRVHDWVLEGVQSGGRILCGGTPISQTLYSPTILLHPGNNSRIANNEVFGPVLCLHTYSTLNTVLQTINASQFGFQASIFTKNTDIAFEVMKNINASAIMLNDHTAFRVDWMPFGGRNSSGIGWGGIPYSIQEYSREKMLVFYSPSLKR